MPRYCESNGNSMFRVWYYDGAYVVFDVLTIISLPENSEFGSGEVVGGGFAGPDILLY